MNDLNTGGIAVYSGLSYFDQMVEPLTTTSASSVLMFITTLPLISFTEISVPFKDNFFIVNLLLLKIILYSLIYFNNILLYTDG